MTGINYGITKKAYQAYWLIKWIVLIVLVILIAFVIKMKLSSSSSEAGVELNKQSSSFYIPTAFELQQALCNAGYKVEVDGVIGKETKAAWDSFTADRFASQYMTKSGGLEAVK